MENLITNTSQLLAIATGTMLLLVLVVIMFKNSKNKKERKIIDSILDAAAIPVFRHSLPQLRKEIARVRRYQHSLSVIVVQPKSSALVKREKNGHVKTDKKAIKNGKHSNGELTRISQIEFMLCGPIFRDALREVDRTTYDGANNRFILILPESTKIQAVQTVNRLKRIMGDKLFDKLQIGLSEFPKDGLIIEDLVGRAMPAAGQKISVETEPPKEEEVEVQQKLKS